MRRMREFIEGQWKIVTGLLVLGIMFALGRSHFGGGNGEYHMNLLTEAMGIVATVFIIDWWYERAATKRLKSRLVREAGSRSNDIALSAVDELSAEGWLVGEHGLLKGQDLLDANLDKADLEGANLEGANLARASLNHARLSGANLKGANLNLTDLDWTLLVGANLEGAQIRTSSLQNATLDDANLSGANLEESVLIEASFLDALLEGATLPDGSTFTSDMDLGRFTDELHEHFVATSNRIELLRSDTWGHDPILIQERERVSPNCLDNPRADFLSKCGEQSQS